MKYTKYVSSVVATAVFAALAVAIPLSGSFANAATANISASFGNGQGEQGPQGQQHPGLGVWMGQDDKGEGKPGMGPDEMMDRPAIIGKVAAINGDSLTVTQAAHPAFGSSTSATATTTFMVDATNATIFKNNATSSVSSIVVGDLVAVQGTVSGTNVTATSIRDGFGGGMHMGMGSTTTGQRGPGFNHGNASSTSPITGNGQPVVAGTISAISGSSLTITNKSNVSYTVDASNAKIVEGQNIVTVSSLSVGDNVIVQGAVNGSSITASSVIDQKAPGTGNASSTRPHAGGNGIFAAIGGFFSHIFGF